jgi:Flp pilus assembly protein TadG
MPLKTLIAMMKDAGGNTATVLAMAAVPLMIAIAGATEWSSITNEKARLQDAVDAAALAGAGQLAVASTTQGLESVKATAESVARTNLANTPALASTVIDTAIANDYGSLTVTATFSHKPMFDLVNLAPTITASATAENLGTMPLCVLQTGTGGLKLNNQAIIRAAGCAVHANDKIDIANSALIQAGKVQAVGEVKGPAQPTGQSGALNIADPFTAMDLKAPLPCLSLPLKIVLTVESVTYLPGVHCDLIRVTGNARVTLLPGEHYFTQPIELKENSTLSGNDVVLIFNINQNFDFGDKATVQLSARKSGKFAGFLIATGRENTSTFKIGSGNVSQLLGTIYIPNANLEISSKGSVAQDSAWSVIVAKQITMTNNPVLVINKNYIGSGVPVPAGVGPKASNPVLVQ